MEYDRAWLAEQIKERLRYYASLTPLGLLPRHEAPTESRSAGGAPPVPASPLETLVQVRDDLGQCTRCALHQGRHTIVFGTGNPSAELMFVGEGPGHEEDVQGLPFVGAAGQLLTKIIQAIELTREEVYIANVIKCRPPGNRTPQPEEIATCRPFLERQIRSVGPRVICTLGRVAAQALLSTNKTMHVLRGQVFSYRDAVLVPTYDPAYLLRSPAKKRETWEDMQLVRRLLDERRR
ncbi:MAG: uracil-DNA glycosylase [Acidobacteriota bacterium]